MSSSNAEKPDTDFQVLLRDAAAGSESAVCELASRYGPHIERAIRFALPDGLKAKVGVSDCMQAIWASMLTNWQTISQIDTAEAFVAYLVRMARNKVVDAQRHYSAQRRDVNRERYLGSLHEQGRIGGPTEHKNARHPLEDNRNSSPSHIASTRELISHLESSLSRREHEILRLWLQGQDTEKIAKRLSVTSRTVRRSIEKVSLTIGG